MALAPTTELAGLAELARLTLLDDRIDALARIAAAIRDEDEVRDHIAALRDRRRAAPRCPAAADRPGPGPSPSRMWATPTMTAVAVIPWAESKVGNRGSTA